MLWCLTLHSTISAVVSWRSVFIRGGNESTPKKPIYPYPHVIDTLYQIMLHRIHIAMIGIKLTTLVVICTDYIGSCKFNYHTIATTTPPSGYYRALTLSPCSSTKYEQDPLKDNTSCIHKNM